MRRAVRGARQEESRLRPPKLTGGRRRWAWPAIAEPEGGEGWAQGKKAGSENWICDLWFVSLDLRFCFDSLNQWDFWFVICESWFVIYLWVEWDLWFVICDFRLVFILLIKSQIRLRIFGTLDFRYLVFFLFVVTLFVKMLISSLHSFKQFFSNSGLVESFDTSVIRSAIYVSRTLSIQFVVCE